MDIEFPVILLAGFHWKINPMAVCGISDNEIYWINNYCGWTWYVCSCNCLDFTGK